MAANSYYQSHDHDTFYRRQDIQHLNTNSYGHTGDPHSASPSYEPSLAPSYHTSAYSDPNAHAQPIPLKSTSKIQTQLQSSNVDWRNQDTQYNQYPLSPESQTQDPSLLPAASRSKRRKRKGGFFSGKIPWVTYLLTLVQLTVFIVEIVKNSIITGSPIMIHPQFNPMIGPSTYVLINMGARFVPCMRTVPGVQDTNEIEYWPCPNTTTNDANAASNKCTLEQLCGMGGLNFQRPNQWWRFVVPMFLHAGIIHIGFNMLLQMTMGREMEKVIGSIRYALVYLSSGIFGFVLGGNFAATAIASTGASGSLFGVLAIVLLDLLYSWKDRQSPVKELCWLIFDIVISFVLGLLPGLDNFSHIGGFLMGMAAGVCILHSPNFLRERIGEESTTYRTLASQQDIVTASGAQPPTSPTKVGPGASVAKPVEMSKFAKGPVGFFKGRKPLWWAWWLIRAGCLIGLLIGFVVLLTNFYSYRSQCSWCKYLSCLPINGWCEIGNLQLNNDPSNAGSGKRDLVEMMLKGEMAPNML